MTLRLPQAPAQYDPREQNLLRSQVEEVLGYLYRSNASLTDDVATPSPTGSIDFITNAATGEVTLRVTPTLNALSFAYRVGTSGYLTDVTGATGHDFVDADTPYNQSLGVLTADDVRYVTVWFYSAPGQAGVVSDSPLGRRYQFASDLGPGSIDTLTPFASSIRPPRIVGTLPTTGDMVGDLVVLTTDSKLYRWNGTAWTAEVPTVDLTGTIATAQIALNAITSALIAASAITTTKIADDAITTPKILAGSVTTASLAAGAVTAAKITAGTITATEIAAGAITAAKIAAGTITANEIAANTITAAKIAAGAITATELAADSVTATKILAGSITASHLNANKLASIADPTNKYIDFAATGTQPFIKHPAMTVLADGTATFGGTVTSSIDGGQITGSLSATVLTGHLAYAVMPTGSGTWSLGSSSNVLSLDGVLQTNDVVLSGTPGSIAGYGLGSLSDVNITSVADKQILVYNATSGKWENQAGLLAVYEETTLLTSQATAMKFVGTGVTATNVGNVVTVTITGNVSSVFGRTGAITASASDYSSFYGQLAAANTWTEEQTFYRATPRLYFINSAATDKTWRIESSGTGFDVGVEGGVNAWLSFFAGGAALFRGTLTVNGGIQSVSGVGYGYKLGGSGVNQFGWYVDATGMYLRDITNSNRLLIGAFNDGSLQMYGPTVFGNASATDSQATTFQAANSNYLIRFKNASGTVLGGFFSTGTGINLNANFTAVGNVLPGADSSYSLGSTSTQYWYGVYARQGFFKSNNDGVRPLYVEVNNGAGAYGAYVVAGGSWSAPSGESLFNIDTGSSTKGALSLWGRLGVTGLVTVGASGVQFNGATAGPTVQYGSSYYLNIVSQHSTTSSLRMYDVTGRPLGWFYANTEGIGFIRSETLGNGDWAIETLQTGATIIYTPAGSSGAAARNFTLMSNGSTQTAYGSYAGAWRSTLQVQGNSAGYLFHLAPPNSDSAWTEFRSVAGGFRFRTGGTASDSGVDSTLITAAGTFMSTLQGRFGGWYDAEASSSFTGLATEIGVSSGQGYVITYNRNSGSYGNLNLTGSNVIIATPTFSGSVTGTTCPWFIGGTAPIALSNSSGGYPMVGYNFYGTNVSGGWAYRATDYASSIYFYQGEIRFMTAPYGSGGLTWSERFRVAPSRIDSYMNHYAPDFILS